MGFPIPAATLKAECLPMPTKQEAKAAERPPSSVCFSDDEMIDDGSELTGPHLDDDGGEADVAEALAAIRSYRRDEEPREILDLKLQITQQRRELDRLASELSERDAEVDVLKSENETLARELGALRTRKQRDRQTQPRERQGWFSGSKDSKQGKRQDDGGGTMQMLLDANADLASDNARLKVVADVTRKSFQSFTKQSRRNSEEGAAASDSLKRENDLLRRRLSSAETFEKFRRSMSDITAKTFSGSSSSGRCSEDIDASHRSAPERSLRGSFVGSLRSIPESELKLGTSGDDWLDEDEGLDPGEVAGELWEGPKYEASDPILQEAAREAKQLEDALPKPKGKKTIPRSRSANLLVDFGEPRRRPRVADGRLCASFSERTGGGGLSDETGEETCRDDDDGLLVDFGDRRSRLARTWLSFRL